MNRQPDVLQIVLALRPPRRFARRLNGRQQQRDQNANNRNHDEKLNKREATLASQLLVRHGQGSALKRERRRKTASVRILCPLDNRCKRFQCYLFRVLLRVKPRRLKSVLAPIGVRIKRILSRKSRRSLCSVPARQRWNQPPVFQNDPATPRSRPYPRRRYCCRR